MLPLAPRPGAQSPGPAMARVADADPGRQRNLNYRAAVRRGGRGLGERELKTHNGLICTAYRRWAWHLLPG